MTRRKHDRRTRPRARLGRGAVMVEALAVTSLMIAILACTLYTHHVFRSKLRVMHEAKAEAMVFGMSGCKATPPGIGAFSDAAKDIAQPEPDVSDDTVGGVLKVSPTGSDHAEQVPGILQLTGLRVSATRQVPCNETPSEAGGGAESLAGTFWESPF